LWTLGQGYFTREGNGYYRIYICWLSIVFVWYLPRLNPCGSTYIFHSSNKSGHPSGTTNLLLPRHITFLHDVTWQNLKFLAGFKPIAGRDKKFKVSKAKPLSQRLTPNELSSMRSWQGHTCELFLMIKWEIFLQ
jgi:hypothetical protein